MYVCMCVFVYMCKLHVYVQVSPVSRILSEHPEAWHFYGGGDAELYRLCFTVVKLLDGV